MNKEWIRHKCKSSVSLCLITFYNSCRGETSAVFLLPQAHWTSPSSPVKITILFLNRMKFPFSFSLYFRMHFAMVVNFSEMKDVSITRSSKFQRKEKWRQCFSLIYLKINTNLFLCFFFFNSVFFTSWLNRNDLPVVTKGRMNSDELLRTRALIRLIELLRISFVNNSFLFIILV